MAAFLHIEVRIWKYRISTFIREDQAEKTDPRRRWLHTTYWINWGFLMNAWISSPAATIADCEEVKDLLGWKFVKTCFSATVKRPISICCQPGNKAFHTKELSSQIGSARLSFAGPEALEEMLGVTPGSVSILALMNDPEHQVQLLVDRDVAEEPLFGCHPCRNTSSLKIRTKDIFDVFLPYTGHSPTLVTLSNE